MKGRTLRGPAIHIVIVAANGSAGDVADLLNSLHDSGWGAANEACTVVDQDETAESGRAAMGFPWVRVDRPGVNLGYGAAINRVVRRLEREGAGEAREAGAALPEWVIACNADLVFPRGSIAAMRGVLEESGSDVGCVAPRLVNCLEDAMEPGTKSQPSVGEFPTLSSLIAGRLRPRKTRKYRETPTKACEVDWATGACLALRHQAFRDVGGFDERMFLDYEDVDLCRRLADAGWRRRFEPEWVVAHTKPNASRPANPERHVHTRASLVRYLMKHRPGWEAWAMAGMMRATIVVRGRRHSFADGWRAGVAAYEEEWATKRTGLS